MKKEDTQRISKLQKEFNEAITKYTTTQTHEKDLARDLQNLVGCSLKDCEEALHVSNNDYTMAANYLLDQKK